MHYDIRAKCGEVLREGQCSYVQQRSTHSAERLAVELPSSSNEVYRGLFGQTMADSRSEIRKAAEYYDSRPSSSA